MTSPTPTEGSLLPGSTAGPWRIVRYVGKGGQAEVYEATTAAGGRFALKIALPPGGSTKSTPEQQLARFALETATLRYLGEEGCPNIVPVEDEGVSADRPWYVMPWFPHALGTASKPPQYAESFAGDVDRVLNLVAALADALAFMHERGIVHRDVHVGNVFLRELGGQPILGDLGLAHHEGESESPISGAENFGPSRWRPPELQKGSRRTHEKASDVYLLGGLLYELLSGGKSIPVTSFIGEPGDDSFAHEREPYALESTDHRMKQVAILLRFMLAPIPEDRASAPMVAAIARNILKGEVVPPRAEVLSGMDRLESAANEWLRRRKVKEKERLQAELFARCEIAARAIAAPGQGPPDRVSLEVAANRGDGTPFGVARSKYPTAVFAAVRVMVRFEVAGQLLLSYVMLGIEPDGTERVAIVDENATWRDVSDGAAMDPKHDAMLVKLAKEELARLTAVMAAKLEGST